MSDLSRLRPFIADSEEDGPGTVLVLKGFSGPEEIHAFMDMLMVVGGVRPREDLKQ